MSVQTAALALDFEVRGEGAPILFISGTSDSRHGFDLDLPAFIGYQLITFDNRDVGVSPRARASYGVDDMVQDTLSVMDRAGVESAHIVGHSMGSVIAQNLYLAAPGRVRSLTLVGSWARPHHFFETVLRNWQRWADVLSDGDLIAACVPYWIGPSAIEAWRIETIVAEFVPAIAEQGREAFKRQVAAALSSDTLDRLGEIRVPTLVVWGEDEQLVLRSMNDELVRGTAGAKLVTMPGVGHSPTVEAPEAFGAAVREFIDSVKPR